MMNKAQEAIDSVKVTMKTADASAAELKLALGDFRKMADTATKTIDSTKLLINKASTGDGTFGTLISDKQMAADLKALISNMRRSGVVFYKDRPLPTTPAPDRPRGSGAKRPRTAPAEGSARQFPRCPARAFRALAGSPLAYATQAGMNPQVTVNLLRALFVAFTLCVGVMIGERDARLDAGRRDARARSWASAWCWPIG